MKRKTLLWAGLLIIIVVLVLGGIAWTLFLSPSKVASEITLEYIQDSRGNIGYTQDVGWVKISEYRKGAEADIIYRVTNSIPDTRLAINFARIFNVDPEKKRELKGRGYQTVPSYYSDWIDVSANGSLEYGETAEYTLVLKIPEGATEIIPDKWVIQTIADVYVGGFAQVTPAVWWTIDMR